MPQQLETGISQIYIRPPLLSPGSASLCEPVLRSHKLILRMLIRLAHTPTKYGMLITDIIEASGVVFLYHGTGRSFLPMIARQGLQPYAGEPGEYEEDEEPYPRVWATQNEDKALEYAGSFPDPVVLRFRTRMDAWESSDWAPGIGHALFSRSPIPSSAIEVFVDGQWRPLNQI
jgi:hypothetical protein